MAIERRVIVGSPNARLSRFVAAAVRVARDYDSDIDVGYGEREADTKRVLEYLMVLGKARRGEQVLVRPNGKMPGKRWKPMPNSWKGSRVGSAGVVVFVLVLVLIALSNKDRRRDPEPWQTCAGMGCLGIGVLVWVFSIMAIMQAG